MWAIIREFFTYFIFLSLLFLLTYSNVNANAFYQVQHLRDVFHSTRSLDHDFTKVTMLDAEATGGSIPFLP